MADSNIPDDLDKLIELLEQPEQPRKLNVEGNRLQQFRKFLKDAEIQKGTAKGVEVCLLYKFYLHWRSTIADPPDVIPPFRFARYLRVHGFNRNKRTQKGHHDRRCLGFSKATAQKLYEWLKANPPTDDDYLPFTPSYQRERPDPENL